MGLFLAPTPLSFSFPSAHQRNATAKNNDNVFYELSKIMTQMSFFFGKIQRREEGGGGIGDGNLPA